MIVSFDKKNGIPYNLLLLADENLQAINKYIHDSDIYVFKKQEEIIAICALNKINDDAIEIKNIAVQKEHQGKGIGTAMIQDAIKRAKDQKFKTILIGTGDASIRQLTLYQKLGFEIFTKKKRFFLDNYPEPIFENGKQLQHMIMLRQKLY